MGFAVLHVKKGSNNAKGLGTHNDRLKDVRNADMDKKGNNSHILVEEVEIDGVKKRRLVAKKFSDYTPELDLQTRIDNRIKEGYNNKKQIRKDAVKNASIVLSGSHLEMKKLEEEGKLKGWIKENYKFISEKFGDKNIVSFVVHLDERTPHIHCVIVPLTSDGRLCAKEFFGSEKLLKEMQTNYAEKMSQFGLKRGIEGSNAKHSDVKHFYGILDKALKQDKQAEIRVLSAVERPKANQQGNYTQKDLEDFEKARNSELNKALNTMQVILNEKTKVIEAEQYLKAEKTTKKGLKIQTI